MSSKRLRFTENNNNNAGPSKIPRRNNNRFNTSSESTYGLGGNTSRESSMVMGGRNNNNSNNNSGNSNKNIEQQISGIMNAYNLRMNNENVRNKYTPLHKAVTSGKTNAAEAILNITKKYLNKGNDEGETPLHKAIDKNDIKIVKLLIKRGADLNIQDRSKRTPLYRAVEKGRLEVVKVLVTATGIDVNQGANMGWTPLNLASIKGNSVMVKVLLTKRGINVDQVDFINKRTPLLNAASRGFVEVIELLINAGASVNLADIEGYTPVLLASRAGRTDVVKVLLAAQGIDVNKANKDGDTPLYIASYRGHAEVVQLLLGSRGIDVNKENKKGETPLYWASRKGHTEVVKLLIKHPNLKIKKDKQLLEIIKKAKPEIVKLVLSHPSINLTNKINGESIGNFINAHRTKNEAISIRGRKDWETHNNNEQFADFNLERWIKQSNANYINTNKSRTASTRETFNKNLQEGVSKRTPYVKRNGTPWTEEEHLKFLRAMKLYGRKWKEIKNYIGTKIAEQIQSHAQKYFAHPYLPNKAPSIHDIRIEDINDKGRFVPVTVEARKYLMFEAMKKGNDNKVCSLINSGNVPYNNEVKSLIKQLPNQASRVKYARMFTGKEPLNINKGQTSKNSETSSSPRTPPRTKNNRTSLSPRTPPRPSPETQKQMLLAGSPKFLRTPFHQKIRYFNREYPINTPINNINFKTPNYTNGEGIYERFEKFVKANPLRYDLFKDGSKLVLIGSRAIIYHFGKNSNNFIKGDDFDFSYYYSYDKTFNVSSVLKYITKTLEKIDNFFIPYISLFLSTLNRKYKLNVHYSIKGVKHGSINNVKNLKLNKVNFENMFLRKRHIGTVGYNLIDDKGDRVEFIDVGLNIQRNINNSDIIANYNGFSIFNKRANLLRTLSTLLTIANPDSGMSNKKFEYKLRNYRLMLSILMKKNNTNNSLKKLAEFINSELKNKNRNAIYRNSKTIENLLSHRGSSYPKLVNEYLKLKLNS